MATGVNETKTKPVSEPYLHLVNDEQFKELMKSLEDIASRLDAVESAVSGVESAVSLLDLSQPIPCAYDLGDVVEALREVKDAVNKN